MPGTRSESQKKVYRLRLKSGVPAASFQNGTKAIELTEESPVFETKEYSEYLGARDLPFLTEDKGE